MIDFTAKLWGINVTTERGIIPLLLILIFMIEPVTVMGQQTTEGEQFIKEKFFEQEEPSIEVLVVGSFHFNSVPEFYDMESEEKQSEIYTLVNNLAEFRPDKIALEFERKDSSYVDSLYRAYRNDNHELRVNEREQVGFRLAKQLDHQKVQAIDYKKPWGMEKVLKWAKKNDPKFVEFVEQWQKDNARLDSILFNSKTIGQILSLQASDAYLDRIQEARMQIMEVGADENYLGIEPNASVYKRNMRIFANLTSIADPGDRILIVYGAGHSYFFNEFISQHPDMKLADPHRYLPEFN
ncbi:hypothetical protein G3570_14740 [Balneolaceae bacterium YR4-1]|uniref:Uncharacterized protein n=1 Tax=Halalkalibaculum roseum TaxID=2709311 RepID=A0A6M1TCN1_9BACT|nr:DUF5694 domain-containing protein [Halalkalibaculum roseum]NGP77903.1 hypothetical protein [Halalkalibaculum roseum]